MAKGFDADRVETIKERSLSINGRKKQLYTSFRSPLNEIRRMSQPGGMDDYYSEIYEEFIKEQLETPHLSISEVSQEVTLQADEH